MGLARNFQHPDVLLERAAIELLNHNLLEAAVGPFTLLADRQPHHTMAWYALGNCFMRLSHAAEGEKYMLLSQLSIRCLKRSLLEDKNNKIAQELLSVMRLHPGITADMYENFTPFNGHFSELLDAVPFNPATLTEAINAFTEWQDRQFLVMCLGEQENPIFVPLLLDVVESDPILTLEWQRSSG